jgi:murein DD-endopeptidase MepM/ murein hydrolase activator NlpD
MMGCDFDIIHAMAKHRNHRKKRHPIIGGGSVTVVMEPEENTEEAEPVKAEAETEAEPVVEETAEEAEPVAEETAVEESATEEPETAEEAEPVEAEAEPDEAEEAEPVEAEAETEAEPVAEETAVEESAAEEPETAEEAEPVEAEAETEAEPATEETDKAEEAEPATEETDKAEEAEPSSEETDEEDEELDPEDTLPESRYTRRAREKRESRQESAAKPKTERKPKAERKPKPKPERKPKAERKPLFGAKKAKQTPTLPAGTNPETVREPFVAAPAKAAKKKGKREPKRFNILFVTDDSKRVKTIHTSADAVLAMTIAATVLILGVFVAIVMGSLKAEDYKAEIEGLHDEITALSEDKIILEAEIETLEQELGSMNSEISAKESQAQAKTELQALQSIPSALPLDSQALPSEYDQEKHWITADAGAGAHVVAAGDGTVSYAGESVEAGGYLVTVDHGNGYETNYYCQAFPVVSQGATVTRGTTLYVIADTDKLIYQIKYEGEFVDPYTVLNIAG